MKNLQCEMTKTCKNPPTHIGEKGYIYCGQCTVYRRALERCRQMKKEEIELLEQGGTIPAYKPTVIKVGRVNQ